jgi:uncharacterized protein (TIGR01777 family)
MKVVIAGGSGFLGQALTPALIAEGHDVAVLSRGGSRLPAGAHVVPWDTRRGVGPWTAAVDGAEVVINLAGESIAAHRWTAAHKRRIEDSRVTATHRLATAIQSAGSPPSLFISASGVNFYGACGDEVVTEDTGAGHDFLAGVCRRWEAQAVAASSPRTRIVCVRTGLVLAGDGGALPQMLPPFRLGVGGPVGTGRQYWAWIHRDDWVAMIRFVIANPAVAGPLNATGETPVTNAEFAQALGRAMRRPAFVRAPAFALRLVLGEMADALLLTGQRAVPMKATRHGFAFRYPTLDAALGSIFRRAARGTAATPR